MIILRRLRVQNFKLLRDVDVAFPWRGSVLVEGLNESGKSTLFESVFFALYGRPLITEGRGRGDLESAIRYGADTMSVDLALEVDETELEVARSLRRGRTSQANLVVRRPGTPDEEVSGVTAVNARIVEELGGLDGEALLNSCFVEQKKLSKLEDLVSGQRKESLRRLLNLERLTSLAEKFRVTGQDERALAEARSRLELAEVLAELPSVAEERARVEEHLNGGPGSPPADRRGNSDSWPDAAYDLALARRAAHSFRRRGNLLAGGATAALALAAASNLASGALPSLLAPLLLLAAAALTLLAWTSYRAAGRERERAARLEGKLSAWRDTLIARGGELESRRRQAETALDLEAATLDAEECRQEVETLARRIRVKRRAAEIVEGAMERIVRLVLPNTERNLGQILPLLTAGRYHEARIGEDYQVQVWDDSAGRYVSKTIFSGGAKDQFSLALRLAFALATLPEELGTTPGFIFLDEPLSSFDGPRTEALVQLLTAGQIAANFSQIFVISHNRSFDVRAFQYHVVMRDGRLVESNLPTA